MSQSDTPAMQNDIQGMSQSDTPATQNDMTACLETSKKERFCSFPHRHGAATRKPETGDETRGSTKTIISCETSSNFHTWKQPRWTGFASSPIDTAKPPENQRLKRDRWEHQNEHFVRDFRLFPQLETTQMDRFCSFPHRHCEATRKPQTRNETGGITKRAFRARLPPISTVGNMREGEALPLPL